MSLVMSKDYFVVLSVLQTKTRNTLCHFITILNLVPYNADLHVILNTYEIREL